MASSSRRLVSRRKDLVPRLRARFSSSARIRLPIPNPRASCATHMRLRVASVSLAKTIAPQPTGSFRRKGDEQKSGRLAEIVAADGQTELG